MFELTVIEMGLEMGAVDHAAMVSVGEVVALDMVGLVKVVAVVEADTASRTATIEIEFVD